jgi:hypothetical protein
LAALLVTLFCGTGQGQIFVANAGAGTIGKYSTTGATLNASLISGLAPEGIAVDGNGYLYVANENSGTIGKYTVTGSEINRTLISGLNSPWAIALDGNGYLFVANYGGSIGKYTTSGEVVNAALVSGLPSPIGIALDGKGHLFVSDYGRASEGWIGSIGEYTTSGATVNAALIAGLQSNWGLLINGSGHLFVAFNIPPGRIAEFMTAGAPVNAFNTGLAAPTAIALNQDGHLLVADDSGGQIGEFTTAGETVNPALIAGLQHPRGLAVAVPPNSAVPAPGDRTLEAGSSVRFSVRCEGTCPLTYQWYLNGTNPAGAPTTNPVLDLASVQPGQSGAYTVVVTNAFGAVTSPPVMMSVFPPVERRMVPALTLMGQPGSAVNLEDADTLGPSPNWATFDNVALTNTSQWCFDLSTPLPPQRFYRAWQPSPSSVVPALDLHMVPALTLTGAVGSAVRVDYINQFGPTDAWVTLATVTLTNTSQLYFEVSAIGQPPRLWRLVPVP